MPLATCERNALHITVHTTQSLSSIYHGGPYAIDQHLSYGQ
jgi:hypothetical protein